MVMKTFKGKSQGKQFDHFRFLSHFSKSFLMVSPNNGLVQTSFFSLYHNIYNYLLHYKIFDP
jgi:hypothetical protein